MFFRRRPKSPAELSDEELLLRYRQQGDVADLGTLYDRHLTEVFAICRRYLRPDEEAQDAVMQLFEQLVDKLRRHEVSNFPAWLHATVRNHCLLVLRARQRAGPAAGGALVVHFPDAAGMESAAHQHLVSNDADDDAHLTEERLQALEHALAELPDGQRRCLELFYLEKKCYADVAQLTGFDLKQVKSYLQNGKRNLKRYLESSPSSPASPDGFR
ncbi:sigma-70 family RNA polymerase sigma factor [Hymenobacter sp. BT507]|uniref:Sigma-70 family RNA polymerase sigma factor n=1 Tax=Hymenobacter citatus TaxID=2763506 RepID=A0ABR7MMG5_9BACT|nr:sigma-70 family RNA polymerase sigma factor [Hymenobacter citatus]MBC6612272.1 sigma-70 family RNA polymerase sigma factor [Hymenobacter citatus]